MERYQFFAYSWFVDRDEKEITSIRVYGIDENNENVCIRIDNFTPYVYVELPNTITWDASKAQVLGSKLDEIMGKQRPLKKSFVMKKRLYGAHFDKKTGDRSLFPYLFCSFSSVDDIKSFGYKIRRPVIVTGLGSVILKVHESDADPVLQLTCCRQIPTAGWIAFHGKRQTEDKITLCEHEFKVKYEHLSPSTAERVPRPLIMSFDIEVNSTNPSAMPNASRPGDKVFQISCVLSRVGDNPDMYQKFLLSLSEPNPDIVGDDVDIYMYDTESDLLVGFTEFIRENNPNIISGYNILCFDIPYMIARAKQNLCIYNFDQMGFHKFAHAKEETIKWSSSAYKNQSFEFLDADGRVFVDLLPLVRRDFKMSNYKLKTITEYFIGETKDPLSVKGIFKCYRLGMQRNEDGEYTKIAKKAMGIVGKYCVQDSVLVARLMDKLQTWVGLTEMAKICNVQVFTLYTQGQQIKVYSQLYKHCMYENIVVEKDVYKVDENERYMGAHVFPPQPGKYTNVVPFDFQSMYPSTIIAYNIDYHTWVTDESIPDRKCHVMEWDEHISCEHDPKVIRIMELDAYIKKEKDELKKLREKRDDCRGKANKDLRDKFVELIKQRTEELKPYTTERSNIKKTLLKHVSCAHRRFRFLREPRGVLPTIIQNLLDKRADIRKVSMKQAKDSIALIKNDDTKSPEEKQREIDDLKTLLDVLDKQQLACKVSANSMYGALGVRRGYLPFMVGAMVVTYMCRVNIEIAANSIQNDHGGVLVYGDTDSNYVRFPHIKTSQETWDHAEHVAREVTKLYPEPLAIAFEEAIYAFFFILTKKRYMYRASDRDGTVSKKIGKKGVLLARRDNSKFVRDVYEQVITLIADDADQDTVVSYILGQINDLCSNNKPCADFVVTKAVGDIGSLTPEMFTNEKGQLRMKVGDYTVNPLPVDAEERASKISKKGAIDEQDYYLLSLPAQVQLAERIRRRGQRVDVGTRLEYVVTGPENHTGKLYDKVESVEYFAKHRGVISIDYMYYLGALVNPLDQVLDIAFPSIAGFTMTQYKYRANIRSKLIRDIRNLSRPKLVFE